MGFRCGIVGLPNVGKSTLFNALTATAAAEASNYPFCTIEPNVGRVPVPDDRPAQIAALTGSAAAIPTQLEFVDIAGLVRGASKGEGLGNRFLGNIRQVEAIAHVVRCFDGNAVHHVEGSVDPVRDIETVETELMLADLESLESRVENARRRVTGGDKDARNRLKAMEPALAALQAGRPARLAEIPGGSEKAFRELQLLTAKPRSLYRQCRRRVGIGRQRSFQRSRGICGGKRGGLRDNRSGHRGRNSPSWRMPPRAGRSSNPSASKSPASFA